MNVAMEGLFSQYRKKKKKNPQPLNKWKNITVSFYLSQIDTLLLTFLDDLPKFVAVYNSKITKLYRLPTITISKKLSQFIKTVFWRILLEDNSL